MAKHALNPAAIQVIVHSSVHASLKKMTMEGFTTEDQLEICRACEIAANKTREKQLERADGTSV